MYWMYKSFDTVLIDTSASRETERIEAPSQSIESIWARLATSMNCMHSATIMQALFSQD